jgi:hypothetical protein
MAIWTRELDLKALNAGSANTAISHLGIEFTEYATSRPHALGQVL